MNLLSLEFFALLSAAFLAYYILPARLRQGVLLCASLIFVGAFGAGALCVSLGVILLNFAAGLAQGRRIEAGGPDKRLLLAILGLDILILVLAKYPQILPFKIQIPAVGMSYYIFLLIGYQADVYLGKAPPETNLVRFCLFGAFFAKFLAGPIERTSNLLSQLRQKAQSTGFDAELASAGVRLFAWGLVKKLVVADNIAYFIDPLYAAPEKFTAPAVLLAVLLYSFQILYDFSAYTDMARGLARLFGYDILENFNAPYFAANIVDFWRRWHISLSSWLRDYLYIPLGGNRLGPVRQKLNVVAVFFICGIWHGGTLNFALWGLMHAFWYALTVWLTPLWAKLKANKACAALLYVLGLLITFHFVTLAWIFFRCPDLSQAMFMTQKAALGYAELLTQAKLKSALPAPLGFFAYIVLFTALFEAISLARYKNWFSFERLPLPLRFGGYLAGAWLVAIFGGFGKQQFIYFQF